MKLFTSESVTEGHPDKVCDQISDAILDAYLRKDKEARVACETCISNKRVMVMGEITSKVIIDVENIVRNKILEIGYNSDELGFNGHNIDIIVDLHNQSEDIARGVDESKESKENRLGRELGAGDQGIMFGYATNEIDGIFMPAAIHFAHNLAKRLTIVRKEGILSYLRPDGKTQVTVKYDNNNNILGIDTIVISAQHDEKVTMKQLEEDIIEYVINKVIDSYYISNDTKIIINPTGKFVIGGPAADSGLTGRKIIVDTYGGYAHHGGGAFSGKDSTKVDRSAAYYARYVAKHIVASKMADKCEIQVAYAIGVAKPVSININTFGTGKLTDENILEFIHKNFDFRPTSMINELKLREPVFETTAAYGHFGNSNYLWEKLPKLNKAIYYLETRLHNVEKER